MTDAAEVQIPFRRQALRIVVLASLALPLPAQEAVFVVRHAEQRRGEDPALSATGERRAHHLAEILRHSGIDRVIASEYRRTQLTAAPLADALGLEVEIFAAREPESLVEALRGGGKAMRVLVVGHSNTVPAILGALGAVETIEIAESEYDDLFLLLPRAATAPLLLHQKQAFGPERSSGAFSRTPRSVARPAAARQEPR